MAIAFTKIDGKEVSNLKDFEFGGEIE